MEKEPDVLEQPMETEYLRFHRTDTHLTTNAVHETIILRYTKHNMHCAQRNHPCYRPFFGTIALPKPEDTRTHLPGTGTATILHDYKIITGSPPSKRYPWRGIQNNQETKTAPRTDEKGILLNYVQCAS
jgi:hypothetical protein